MGEERPSFYAVIPASVRYDKKITPNAKLLYGEITALCNEKGYCWASNEYFANLYGVSKTSISKWIASLIENQYINSTITYKQGTKEIDKRCLSLVKYPIEEKLNTPIEEKLKDNNTLFNNTINNTYVDRTQNCSVESDLEQLEKDFNQIYKIYPKKVGRAEAFARYCKWVRKSGYKINGRVYHLTNRQIWKAVKKYVDERQASDTDLQYYKGFDVLMGKSLLDYVEIENE